jgi:hypothetical protein
MVTVRKEKKGLCDIIRITNKLWSKQQTDQIWS